MRLFSFFCFLLSVITSIYSQDNWEYYAQDYWIQDIQVIGDKVWIGNPTALHILDIETGEGQKIQSINSQLKGSFIKEILPAEDHVWIALEEGGIARYTFGEGDQNGSWDQFYTPINGSQDTIYRARNLMEDKNGRLWFDMGYDGRLFLFSIENDILFEHSDLNAEQPFFGACHGSQKIYYRTKKNLLYVFDTETLESTHIPLPDENFEVYTFTAFKDELYVSFSDDLGESSIYTYSDSWNKITNTKGTYNLRYSKKGADRFWINGVNDDPEFMAINSTNFEIFKLQDLIGPGVFVDSHTDILNEDEDGRIWLNSTYTNDNNNQGVHVYSVLNNQIKEYDVKHSYFQNSFNINENTEFDCNGNLLIVGLTTVQIFHPDSSKIIKVNEDRSKGDLEFITYDELNCKYYVAQNGHNQGGSYIHIFENDIIIDSIELGNESVTEILKTSDGKLYVGLALTGVAIYDENNNFIELISEPFYNPESNWLNFIYDIKEYENGQVVFGTSASLVVLENSNWTTYDKSNSPIGSELILTSHIDKDGNILVPFKGGIYKYNGLEWEYIEFFNPYNDYITSLHQDEIGNYWLGTQRNGLLYWNGFDFQQFEIMNSAIPTNKISQIMQHPLSGDLWLSTNRGVVIFDRDYILFKKGIFGKTFYDASQDMIYDAGVDIPLDGIPISINDELTIFSDVNGNYSYYSEDNSLLSLDCLPQDDFEFTTPSTIDTFLLDENILNLNFGLWKDIDDKEIEMDITFGPFICSTEISAWITIKNSGWNTVSGQTKITLPPEIKIISTYPDADNLTYNEATWNFDKLNFNEQRSFYSIIQGPDIEDLLEQLDTTNTVLIPVTASLTYNGNVFEQFQEEIFLCSYDPNDKISNSTGPSIENYSLLEDALEFTIRFQNEGNYKATDVIIIDTLDNQLDLETFELISSSHLVSTQLNPSNELVFRFLDIDLPPKSENEALSQGFVKFRIAPKNGLQDNSIILNKAAIYFDSNAPILTNTTENILVEELPLISLTEGYQNNIQYSIVPNPFHDIVTIKSNSKIYNLSVHDTQGQILIEIPKLLESYHEIDLSDFSSGIYFINVSTENELRAFKIVKL